MSAAEKLAAIRAAKMQPPTSAAEKLAAIRAAKMQPLVEEALEEPEGVEYARGLASEAMEGATFGWGDEISSGMAAGMGGIANMLGDDDGSTFSERYKDIKGAEDDRRKVFQKANPKTTLAANVVGGLTTGGLGLTKSLGTQAFKQASTAGKLLRTAGVGAVEGGLAGAGASDTGADAGEMIKDTARGAAIGAALPLAMKGVGGAWRGMSNRHVADDVVNAAGEVTPLNISAKGTFIGDKYQKMVAPAYGGGKVIEQSQKVMGKTLAKQAAAKEALEAAKTTSVTDASKLSRAEIRANSMPTDITPELKTKILASDGQEANKLLEVAWKSGFKEVKEQTFNINPKQLVKDALDELDDPAYADFRKLIFDSMTHKLKGGFIPNTAAPLAKYTAKGMSSVRTPRVKLGEGTIKGDWLMQARNDLKIMASDIADKGAGALEIGALHKASRRIDDLINAQLPKGAKKAFARDLKNWGSNRLLADSTTKAVVKGQGEASIENILQTSVTRNPRAMRTGSGKYQTELQGSQVSLQGGLAKAKANLEAANVEVSELRKHMPKEIPDTLNSLVNTGVLGAPAAILHPAAVLPAGAGAARTLASPTTQRIIAGQTNAQTKIADIIRRFDTNIASKYGGRESLRGATSRAGIYGIERNDEEYEQ